MSRKAAGAAVALGAVLILSALLLVVYNRYEAAQAGQAAENALSELEAAIEEEEAEAPEDGKGTGADGPELPVETVDGYEYIGYLEIPVLGLKLPVMSDWSYEQLRISPCRQSGSSYSDDLVIAAHNYSTHFGRLKELSAGDTVTFTDMDGVVNTYCVERLETVEPDAVDSVLNSGCDLVLYTCTKGGKTRVTAFCDRADRESADGWGRLESFCESSIMEK